MEKLVISRKKILFLGETYRADAITWINGLVEFGDYSVETFELKHTGRGFRRLFRLFEFLFAIYKLRKFLSNNHIDLIVAERVTSYGFLAAITGFKPFVVAQQGITDIYPLSGLLVPIKKIILRYTFKRAALIHAWGEAMVPSMLKHGADLNKVMILPKGIDLRKFNSRTPKSLDKIKGIVTRSLSPDYRHEVIIKSVAELKRKKIPFELIIIGDGPLRNTLQSLVVDLGVENEVFFTGRISNDSLPSYLQDANLYLSMPCTEGMSASLLEAFATECYPIVSDLPGNRAWIHHLENGLLVTVDNVQECAKSIEYFWENRYTQFDTVTKKNLETVKKLADFETNMKIIVEKYKTIVD